MTTSQQLLQALAESAAPLARELTTSLLARPVPVIGMALLSAKEIAALYHELQELLAEAVPALQDMVEEMSECDIEDVEELFDDLAPPALDLVDMAHKLWQAPLAPEAENVRPLLCALAEAPVAQLLKLLLHIIHGVIAPLAVMGDAEKLPLAFTIAPENTAALAAWCRANPGILPDALGME